MRSPWAWVFLFLAAAQIAQADLDSLLIAAKIHMSAGELSQADRLFQQVLQQNSQNSYAWQQRGLISINQDQCGQAEYYFTRALDLVPGDPFLIKWTGIAVLCQKAPKDTLAIFKNLEAALAIFKNLAQQASSEVDQADAYYFMGAIYSLRRDTDQALDLFRRASAFKAYPETHLRLARAYHELEQYALAESEYKKVLTKKPEHVGARNDLGWLYYAQNRPAEAVAQWRRVLEHDQKNREARNSLGKAYNDRAIHTWRQGQKQEARRLWQAALSFDTNNKATRWFLEHYR
jgi:tetratricopeptide (TPR) repeat protein